MPLSRETVQNRNLSGPEAAKIILDDLKYLLERDGAFSDFAAFQDLAYKITLEVQMNNNTYPELRRVVNSRPKPGQNPVIQQFPMKQEEVVVVDEGTGEPVVDEQNKPVTEPKLVGVATSRTRKNVNPNKERVKRGMPVKVVAPDQKGRLVDKDVVYDPNSLPPEDRDLNVGTEDKDETLKKKGEWGWEK